MAITTILFKRGDSPLPPNALLPGEPGWRLDTGKLYIGIETEDGRQNKLINVLDEDEAEELLTQIESLVATMQTFDDRIKLNTNGITDFKDFKTTAETWMHDTGLVIAQQGGDIASINTEIGDVKEDIAGIEGDLARETETRDNQYALALGFDSIITISRRVGTGGNGFITTTDDLSNFRIGSVMAVTLPEVGPYYYLAKLMLYGTLQEDPNTPVYWLRIFRYNETMNLIKVPIIPDEEIPIGEERASLPRLLMLVQKDIDGSVLGGPMNQVHRYRRVEFIPRQITGGNIYIQDTEPSDPDCVWIDTNGIDLIME